MRVKLKADLTRYHPSLKPGTEGETLSGDAGSDRFVKVRFPEHTLPVLWESVERIRPYNELARRLAAAAISYQLGLRGVDYALKTYVSEEPGELWQELAETVTEAVAR